MQQLKQKIQDRFSIRKALKNYLLSIYIDSKTG